MDADRRRRVLSEMLAELEALPEDVAGHVDGSALELLEELSALKAIEARLINRLARTVETGRAVERFLDLDLLNSGGWRFRTEAEQRSEEAQDLLDIFRRFNDT